MLLGVGRVRLRTPSGAPEVVVEGNEFKGLWACLGCWRENRGTSFTNRKAWALNGDQAFLSLLPGPELCVSPSVSHPQLPFFVVLCVCAQEGGGGQ